MSETETEFVERLANNREFWANEEVDKLLALARLGAMVSDMESKTRAIVGEPSPPAGETE